MKWLALALLSCVALVYGMVTLPVLLPLALVGTSVVAPPGVVPSPAALPPLGPSSIGNDSLMQAIQPWLGSRYVFGGNVIGAVDCSGFSLAVMRAVYRVSLPRTAQTQYDHTNRVDRGALQPGDLVFFARTYQSPDWITHVGIYVGDGWMISAIEPTLGRQSLDSPYWLSHYAGAGRVRR